MTTRKPFASLAAWSAAAGALLSSIQPPGTILRSTPEAAEWSAVRSLVAHVAAGKYADFHLEVGCQKLVNGVLDRGGKLGVVAQVAMQLALFEGDVDLEEAHAIDVMIRAFLRSGTA